MYLDNARSQEGNKIQIFILYVVVYEAGLGCNCAFLKVQLCCWMGQHVFAKDVADCNPLHAFHLFPVEVLPWRRPSYLSSRSRCSDDICEERQRGLTKELGWCCLFALEELFLGTSVDVEVAFQRGRDKQNSDCHVRTFSDHSSSDDF